MPPSLAARRAGLLVPLFSLPSSRSWGIGEIPDIGTFSRWLGAAGIGLLQLLPINEMPPGETSPYSALSAMAVDPQFIALEQLEDFHAIGGTASFDDRMRAELDAVRWSATIEYRRLRDLKQTALRRVFAHFRSTEWATGTRRAAAFRAYIEEQRWWLEDYALFRALHARHHEQAWTTWPEAVRARRPEALAAARAELCEDILFRQYLQWVAGDQWRSAREACGEVALFGDLPFMVSADSADVWAHQDEFRMDASVGVPPDAFSDTGQDWGLPVYNWDIVAERDFHWLRDRARRNADLYDGYRVDHLVGFYRTYFRPHDGSPPEFTPADEAQQLALGERVLATFRAPGAEIIAEDLGVVPDFVRESLARMSVPGYKVFRWEREWHVEGQPFKDPSGYPAISVATSGTHDTEPMVVWWEDAPRAEREAVLAIPAIRKRLSVEDAAAALEHRELSPPVHETLVEVLYASGANVLILPIQDVFGWRDRINQPATVNDGNWTWRLAWPSDRFGSAPAASAVARQLNAWAKKYGRA